MRSLRAGAVVAAAIAVLAGCGGGDDASKPAAKAHAKTQAGRIVFAADGDITAINPDGTGRTTLLKSDAIEINPRWSPDGRRVVFARGDGAIYVMNADGTGVRRVTEPRPGTEQAALSHDGRRIAYNGESRRGFTLYVANVDGSGRRPLRTVRHGWVGDPDFSPDDRHVAFALDPTEGGETDVWVIDTGGAHAHRVTHAPGDEGGENWSPDGKSLLFGAGGDGLFTVGAGGNGLRRLTGDRLHADTLNPVWSPDGRRIAWTAKFEGGGGSAIYVMDANGSHLRRVTGQLSAETPVDW